LPLRPPSPSGGRSTQQREPRTEREEASSLSRTGEAARRFPSHSPTLRPWIVDRRLRTTRIVVLRGGALEPEPRTSSGKIAG